MSSLHRKIKRQIGLDRLSPETFLGEKDILHVNSVFALHTKEPKLILFLKKKNRNILANDTFSDIYFSAGSIFLL